MRLKRFWMITLLIVIGIMIMIFLFSEENAAMSSQKSGALTEYLLTAAGKLMSAVSPDHSGSLRAGNLENIIRKCAHFMEYTLLSFFMNIHMYAGELLFSEENSTGKRGAFSIITCALYAGTDELHQYFVPGRACRLVDVGIDTAGALFGMLLFLTLPTQKVTMWLTMQKLQTERNDI